jgi:hypothetical protein
MIEPALVFADLVAAKAAGKTDLTLRDGQSDSFHRWVNRRWPNREREPLKR